MKDGEANDTDSGVVDSQIENVESLESAESEMTEEAQSTGCFSRLRDDFCHPFFGVKEVNGEITDVQASFAPQPKLRTLTAKICLFGWSLSVLAQGIAEIDTPDFYLAYLTHWSLVVALMYMIASVVLSLLKEPVQPDDNGSPGFSVRFTWALYSIGSVAEITATLLFWILVFDPKNGVTYELLMTHGGVMVLILLEGLLVNRIPVRGKHLLFPMMFSLAYVIWTIIHATTNIGNPNSDDGDAIYSSLNWKDNPGSATVVAVVCLFIVVPLLFLIVWHLSIMSGPCRFDGSNRRYYVHSKDTIGSVDEEMAQ